MAITKPKLDKIDPLTNLPVGIDPVTLLSKAESEAVADAGSKPPALHVDLRAKSGGSIIVLTEEQLRQPGGIVHRALNGQLPAYSVGTFYGDKAVYDVVAIERVG